MAKILRSSILLAAIVCYKVNGKTTAAPTTAGPCDGNGVSLSASNISTGYILSPNYPNPYDNNLNCTWTITAESTDEVVFASVEVKDVLSDDDQCLNDSIKLYSSSIDTDNLLLTLCDQTASTVKPVTGSFGNVLVVNFQSDGSGTSTGFRILYFAVTSSGTQSCSSDLGTPSTFTPFYNSLPNTFTDQSWCSWELNTKDNNVGYRVDVLFSDFGGSCSLDEFTIRDGTESGVVLGSVCATSTEGFTATYMSSGKKMHFRLTASDTTGDKYGIFLIYKTRSLVDTTTTTTTPATTTTTVAPVVCSSTGETLPVEFGTSLTLTSPNYPSNYDNSAECRWTITTNDDTYVIQLDFDAFDVGTQNGTVCPDDKLTIYDGNSDSSVLIAEYCGNSVPGTTKGTSTSVYLVFQTDAADTSTGFSLTYQLSLPFTDSTCVNNGSTSLTSYAEMTQYVTSPGYPSTYGVDLNCKWVVTAHDPSYNVLIHVEVYDVYSQTSNCNNDFIKVFDGDSTTGDSLLTLCSETNSEPTEARSTGDQITVQFNADANNDGNNTGFKFLYFSASKCEQTAIPLTATFGQDGHVSSPDFPSQYANSDECKWIITSSLEADGYLLQIDFVKFDVEYQSYCSYDALYFYDGDSISSPVLNQVCGSSLPGQIRSTGSQILVYFTADSTIPDNGFLIKYTTINGTYPDCVAGALFDGDATNEVQTIASTGFAGGSYTSNVDEYWVIRNPGYGPSPTSTLVLKVTEADIERASGCIYDKLEIHLGPCLSDTIFYTYCYSYPKRLELTEHERYLIHFHTDSSVNRQGFTMDFYLVSVTTTPPTTTSTTTTAGPDAGVVGALIKELTNSSSYDKDALPVQDLTQAVQGSFKFYLVGINGLDEVEGKLTATGLFQVQWTDFFLSWIPARKQGIVTLLIPQNDVWKPDIVLLNGFTKLQKMGASFMNIVLNYDGKVLWAPYQILESICSVDLTKFPYDVQTCGLKFGTYTASSSEVNMTEGGFEVHESFNDNNEWTLVGIGLSSNTSGSHTVVTYEITLRRNSGFISYYIIIPIILLSFMNVFTFNLPLESGERSGYSITIFLAFVVYLVVVSEKLPTNSDITPYLSIYIMFLVILSALSLFVTLIELKLFSLKLLYFPIGVKTRVFTLGMKTLMMKLICSKYKEPDSTSNLSSRPSSTKSDTRLVVSYKPDLPTRPKSAPVMMRDNTERNRKVDTTIKPEFQRTDTTISVSAIQFYHEKTLSDSAFDQNKCSFKVVGDEDSKKEEPGTESMLALEHSQSTGHVQESYSGDEEEKHVNTGSVKRYHAVPTIKKVEMAIEEKPIVETFAAMESGRRVDIEAAGDSLESLNVPAANPRLSPVSKRGTGKFTPSTPGKTRNSNTFRSCSTEPATPRRILVSKASLPSLYQSYMPSAIPSVQVAWIPRQSDEPSSKAEEVAETSPDDSWPFSDSDADVLTVEPYKSDTDSQSDDDGGHVFPCYPPKPILTRPKSVTSMWTVDVVPNSNQLETKPKKEKFEEIQIMDEKKIPTFSEQVVVIQSEYSENPPPYSEKVQNTQEGEFISQDWCKREETEAPPLKEGCDLKRRKQLEDHLESNSNVTWQDITSWIDFFMFWFVLVITIVAVVVFLTLMQT